MVDVLRHAGHQVYATDILHGQDFLACPMPEDINSIVTNPPYAMAQSFIEKALECVGGRGFVAMLLRCDFDHAVSRRHLFADCGTFSKRLVLTKRIKWFEGSAGSPSFNHAWYLWNYLHDGPPTLAYAP